MNMDTQIWSAIEAQVKDMVLANGGASAYEVIKDEDLKPNLAAMALRNLKWLKKLDASYYYDAVFDGLSIMIKRQKSIFSRWSPELDSQVANSKNLEWAKSAQSSSKFWAYYKTVFHRVFGEVRRNWMTQLQKDSTLSLLEDESIDEAIDSITATADSTSFVEDEAIYEDLVDRVASELASYEAPSEFKNLEPIFNEVCLELFARALQGSYDRLDVASKFDTTPANISKIRKYLYDTVLPEILTSLGLDVSFLEEVA